MEQRRRGRGLAKVRRGRCFESWDGQCPGPIIEKVKKKTWGGDKMRLPNEKQGGGPSIKADRFPPGRPAAPAVHAGAEGGKAKVGAVAGPRTRWRSERWKSRREGERHPTG